MYNENVFSRDSNNIDKDNNTNEDSSDINELFKELNILNISFGGILLVLVGIVISIQYLLWSRIGVLDKINNTNNAQQIGDLSESPKISNKLYLISTIIFTFIIYYQYREQILEYPSQMDESAISDAYNQYVSIILILMGTIINYFVLNKPEWRIVIYMF